MKIKIHDQIKVRAGKDRGKSGKVLQVFPTTGRASVEGINILIKHLRPRRQGEQGQRVEFSAPMDMSNLALICPKCGQPTRVGYRFEGGDKPRKERICKKCTNVID